MTFLTSPEDEAFRAEVRAWLADAVADQGPPPPAGDWAARRAYDVRWQRRLSDAGYAGMGWSREFGGRGASLGEQLVFLEENARAGAPPPGTMFVGTRHAGPTLIAEGTDAQRAHHLPRILRGEDVWCQGFSEPEAGSDLASLRTRAVRDGDHYVVTGHKIWSTRAQVADYCELLVRTDPDAPRHQGISWLILDMRTPGIEVRPLRTIDDDDHFCEIFLDGARVPVANLVGAENDGWRVANVTLRFERGTAFASHIVELGRTLRALVRLARTRRDGSGVAWDDAGLRRDVGIMAAEVTALWRMTQMSIAESARTGLPAAYGSAVKLRYSELAQSISELFVRVAGRPAIAGETVDGFDTGTITHDYLWSLHTTIAAGTSQIQRNVIAERVLGLPKGA
ncbi:acyl-CoA dehydrogenase family protein [Actinomadura rugatobispora]|uniref:Acyl-CoA dehydrogenase family protein n=1 Tax=Actinomadura rugatobispora TaxID=1994 RepID=A0ABW0ZSP0_9ACTN|nr:acyl-CoA dehydrogenase family protein [Actinomadura rugatobispora]